ncbi:MAG: hypothetical protein WAU59_20580, partial [Rhodoplanes sp.]
PGGGGEEPGRSQAVRRAPDVPDWKSRLVAGTGLDNNDIEEIRNAIEAAVQGTRYEELFSITSTREIESDTSIYYLRVRAPCDGIMDDYADMERRLQSSLLCHLEFASQ